MVKLTREAPPALPQVAEGLARREAVAVLIAERRNDAGGRVFKGVLIVAILGLLILLIPDRVDFSFEIGKLKLDKLVGQKEFLCVLTALTLYRFAIDLSKFTHYGCLYDYQLDTDFGDHPTGLVRHVADDKELLQLYYTKTDSETTWRVLGWVRTTRKLLTFAIVLGSIGAAFVVTTVNIAKLIWSPTIGGAASYILLIVAMLLLVLFLVSSFEAIALWDGHTTAELLRKLKKENGDAANAAP